MKNKFKYPTWLNSLLLLILVPVMIVNTVQRFRQQNTSHNLWLELKKTNKIELEFVKSVKDLDKSVDNWYERVDRANLKAKQVNEFLKHIKSCPLKD